MSTDQPIRLTLPPHLVEKIRALLIYDIARQLDGTLRDELQLAVEAVDASSSTELAVAGSDLEQSAAASSLAGTVDEKSDDADEILYSTNGPTSDPRTDPAPPPTIPEETLEQISRWADTKVGRGVLKRYRLKPGEYSMISLLAGARVYIPPSRLARLNAAEVTDKPNPFLPTYLSPQPPSLGKEFSSLTKQLTTVLNVLFSIFGSAFAVYVAGTTGAGYSRETSILLGILAGAVVGVAEAVLVWIFSARVKEGRKERWARGARMGRGSAGLGPRLSSDEGGDGEIEKKELAELEDHGIPARDNETQPGDNGKPEVETEVTALTGQGDTTAVEAVQSKGIRLRRRPLELS